VAQTNNGSYVTGTHIDAQRIGADLEATAGQFQIISEALLGKNGDVDAKGGYVTVAYTQGKTQPYVRYDVYDPNTDTANNSFERWTGGVGYYVTPNAKLSLEYEAINDDTQPNLNGRLTTQYQISF
jgi:phosphate-selective porin